MMILAFLKPLLTGKSLLILAIVALFGWQQIGLNRLQRANNDLVAQLAKANGTIQQLNDAVKNLPVGQSRTVYVDRPYPVTVEGPGKTQVVEKQVPVVVTRTEHTIETRIQTLTLPPKEIQTIIDKSPQTLVFDLTATRDIAKGEKFQVVASQVAPGIFQPILQIGAPVSVEEHTVTPIQNIPKPVLVKRWTFAAYTGYSALDRFVTGLRADYSLSRTWSLEGSTEYRWQGLPGKHWDARLLLTATF